jgi:hypothetical protein
MCAFLRLGGYYR